MPKSTVQNSEINADATSANPTATPESAAELDQLRVERDGLRFERDELRDTLLRRQAEFDNFRKRIERERQDQIQYASMDVVGDLLPILDDFERALTADASSPEYAKGVQLIYQRMAEGRFPKARSLGPRCAVWVETEIDAWVAAVASA